jgi:nucleotide-binding universal stress UspA family protein/CBS domain-containing protein
MEIKTLMTSSPMTLDHGAPLALAAERLGAAPGGVILVLRDGRVAGIVTGDDLRRVGPSTVPELARWEWQPGLERLSVGDAIAPGIPTVSPMDSAPDAARAMAASGREALAVVEGGEAVGVVTLTALLSLAVEELEHGQPARIERVLLAIALDGRDGPAIETALDLARRERAELTAIHVLWPLRGVATASLTEAVWSEIAPVRRDAARDRLVELLEPERARCEVALGEPCGAIVALAAQIGADLIVMGGGASSGARRRSSLVRAVVRRATCPVLAV